MKPTRRVALSLLVLAVAIIAGLSANIARADDIATFDVNATGTCGSFPCASTVSISGVFTVDLTTGEVSSGTMTMSDAADLVLGKSSFQSAGTLPLR